MIHLAVVLMFLAGRPSYGNVPTPPPTPPVPGGYCSTIYNELQGYLDSFNQTLGNPAPYPGTLQIAQLQLADSNVGPALSGPNYLSTVLIQAQELKALGFQGVKIEVAFPVLFSDFYGAGSVGVTGMQPYLNFYQQLAQNLHSMGLKVLVENNVTLSTGTEAGWSNVGSFYHGLSWDAFVAGRATMAATVAQYMQPDFLMVSEEPDNEALNAGQPNLNNPLMAASMITSEIASVRAVSFTTKIGAGFGTWMGPYSPSGLIDYLNAYVALPLDYIDMHIYPINTEYNGLSNLLQNSLTIANGAAAALKPVAISESWPWKMEDHEFNVLTPDTFRARNPFSFWAPIDTYFIQTMQKLANYTQMLYLTSQGNDYFQAYQTYGGTTANGGAANCTCTTVSCSNGDIVTLENSLASQAGQIANFTSTGLAYYGMLEPTPDTTAPAGPVNLQGNAGYNSATISWTGSSDDVGVAGYNIYRCAPAPCTGQWIANSAATNYFDSGLDDNTPYQYTVQAFDIANNLSPVSDVLNLTTALNTPPNAPTGTFATAVSPKQITLSWTPPQNTSGLSKYLIYQGTTMSNLVQIATMPSTSTTFQNQPLQDMTTYYYGVIAVEQNLNSPMSPIVSATTLPLPNPPTPVATAVSAAKITLTWTEQLQPGGLPIANYQVFEGTTPGVMTKIATTTQTNYNVLNLSPSTTYYFEVMAVDTSFDDSPPSNPVSATTMPLPPPPSNLQVTFPAATKYKLSWQWTQAPGGLPAARFNVYCGTTPTGEPKVATTTAYSYTYLSATPLTPYFCYVMAADTANDNSLPSLTLPFVTPPMPSAPIGVLATATKSTKVTVTWSEIIPPNGLSISSYKIYRSNTLPVTTANYVAQRTTPSYTDLTVTSGKTYYYAISAIDSGQDASPLSLPAVVTTP